MQGKLSGNGIMILDKFLSFFDLNTCSCLSMIRGVNTVDFPPTGLFQEFTKVGCARAFLANFTLDVCRLVER